MRDALAACMSSVRSDWATPDWLVEKVRSFFGGEIELDPCGDGLGRIATRCFTVEDNGLLRDWGTKSVYANPPYGRAHNEIWARKITQGARNAQEIIALTTARTDTKWFVHLAEHCSCVCLVTGRLTFLGAAHGAPFPSAIWYFGPRHEEFRREFADVGLVMFEIG